MLTPFSTCLPVPWSIHSRRFEELVGIPVPWSIYHKKSGTGGPVPSSIHPKNLEELVARALVYSIHPKIIEEPKDAY